MASAFARWRISLVVLLLLGVDVAHAAFDKPLKTTVVQVTRPHARTSVTLTCFYYATFMVKVITGDPGPSEEYASAVVPGHMPTCGDISQADYDEGHYAGYGPFKGVKGGFAFFDSVSSGEHGDRAFDIVSDSGRLRISDWKIGEFQSIRLVTGGIVLRYRRMFPYHCSLYYGAATACWTAIKTETALTDALAPDCREAYEDLIRTYKQKRSPWSTDTKSHSADLSYNVEARYDGHKATFTPLPGPVGCWPSY